MGAGYRLGPMLLLCGIAVLGAGCAGRGFDARDNAPVPAFDPAFDDTSFAGYSRYREDSGEGVYRAACQSCHMPDGSGARGAGTYPPLAANPALAAAAYPVVILLSGRRAMPAFADTLSDEQIATLVSYLRSNFGNDYAPDVTSADVADLRRRVTGAKP